MSALALRGKILNHEGKNVEALKCLRQATEDPEGGGGTLDYEGAGEAMTEKGILLLKIGQREEAKQAFQKAALDLDDPLAYYYLARWSPSNSPEETVYLLKSASSGVKEAIFKLARVELEKFFEREGSLPKKMKGYGMAGEWMRVAAEKEDGLCMLHLACMFKSVGDMEGWREWYEKMGGKEFQREEKLLAAMEMWKGKGVEFI